MLEKIQLRNFQCHERLDITLDPRITTLVGESDVGKSAVLRALRWISLNRPAGDGIIQQGFPKVRVRLVVDGHHLQRRKGDGDNVYRWNAQEYRAFGTDVPADVSKLLGLSDINFCGQHDPPFWFCLTAGEVAKQLNQIVDLEAIDLVASRVAQRIRTLRVQEDVTKQRWETAEQRATSLKSVLKSERVLKSLETAETKIAGWVDAVAQLTDYVGRLRAVERRISAVVPNTATLDTLVGRLTKVDNKVRRLNKLVGELQVVEQQCRRAGDLCRQAASRLAAAKTGNCPVCGKPWKGR